jgi:hypothetical protein
MKKTFQYAIWNEAEDKVPLDFIESILISLNDEINLCVNHFLFEKLKIKNSEDQHMFYWLGTEMSWIGLLNNAIVRRYGNSVCTLREITLHAHEKGLIGRPDLLVSYHHSSKIYHLLFEGKMNEWTGKWKPKSEDDEMKMFYDNIYNQSVKYKDTLVNEIITNYEPIIITIGFDWMRSKEAIEAARNYFVGEDKERQTEFCALYTIENSGMWAYGKIFN